MGIIANIKKLKKSEKMMLAAFVIVIGGTLFYRAVYKPIMGNIKTYKHQIKKMSMRLDELRSRFPEVESQKSRISSLSYECDRLLAEITDIEAKLPSKKNASQLVGELTRLAEKLKLISIQQKLDDGEEYSRIFVELRFHAPFKEIVKYVKSIESISPFLKIEELGISELKKKKTLGTPGVEGHIMVSSLLGETPVSEMLKAEEKTEFPELARDIFVSKKKPVAMVKLKDYTLDGITYTPTYATAILDGEVVTVGSKVGDLEVKDILPEQVILTDGFSDYIVNFER